ncbi:MAG: PD-(D/E)XK nuclease family transposase, partial [Bacteroidota bacterium]|nr:PD-(D/E)XK nuclease family transposase [Bacteroidota bacterium]
MTEFKERYINPFTDYGFKRLFGEEPNKDLLLDFLNELLKDQEGKITELSYLPNEKLPISVGDRRAIFDIYCTNAEGEQFIVEIQKAEQSRSFGIKDRTIFYSTFPIQEQARNKDRFWNFELKAVYTIGILDFVFE